MEGKKLLHSIRLTNLLSYGSEGVELELEPLNVLIGPNASGKSNLIEAISLLAAAPRDLQKPIREGGGIEDWLWKGSESTPGAILSVLSHIAEREILSSYDLAFTATRSRFTLLDESIEINSVIRKGKKWRPANPLIYEYNAGVPLIRTKIALAAGQARFERTSFKEVAADQSILSQARGDAYPELTSLAGSFARIALFRDWSLGRVSAFRHPQKTDLPEDFLLEDASNLVLVLNDLQHRPVTKRSLLENLRRFYEDLEDVTTKVQGGTIQVFFHERGLRSPVPAARLSDGTLHYLCLLTILLHPEPPPLICIEEPELGLHPDVIPIIAELLIDSSKRSQLIVTTHSESLVSALSQIPESVIVCERDDRGTRLQRLEPKKLREWLERYRLGELWAMGEIGGNR